ncbi:caspase family protein [Bacillus mycoides]|uniref:caspase family protein n=1 Tax=Bacillus mycoides TaxID=1405 RepID=UPI000BEFCE6A|nr:caspase family protein [Bacillus mycoides]PEK93293.1 caspase [Bacillus mycoides]
MSVKALVIGVSNYFMDGAPNLPFCKNDIEAMAKSLENGLGLKKSNIITCGGTGDVIKEDFDNALARMASITNEEDVLLFYFSGHGQNFDQQHHLILSDDFISTNELIKSLERIPAKSKVVFLDCCYSGNYSIEDLVSAEVNQMITEFHGKGYAVFSSSNAEQVSYGHPDKPISIFTSFLCDAFESKLIVKKGKVSLNDIHKLVKLYLDIWNKKNPTMQQYPIFKRNMGGTIFFKVDDYKPFYTAKVYFDSDQYIIYEVEPAHTGNCKRYGVKVILKEPLSFEEISKVSIEIRGKVKTAEVYKTQQSFERWNGKLANIIWIYFGFDESDMKRSNFICHTTWCDNNQNKDWWYNVDGSNKFMIKDTHFNVYAYYESLKMITKDNTGDKEKLMLAVKEISRTMLKSAEEVISFYNEYINGLISEANFIEQIEPVLSKIEEFFMASTELDIAPIDLQDWMQKYLNIFGTIHDFTFYYNEKYLAQRTPENRKACMEMTIKNYYTNLEEIVEFES